MRNKRGNEAKLLTPIKVINRCKKNFKKIKYIPRQKICNQNYPCIINF